MLKNGIKLKEEDKNSIDDVWTEENGRPTFTVSVDHNIIIVVLKSLKHRTHICLQPKNLVIQPLEFSGKPWTEKVSDLRQFLNDSQKTGMVVSELDEIAWLFNMRGEGGSTVDSLFTSPLFQSLALVTMDDIILWVHQDKVDDDIREHLNPEYCNKTNMCVEIKDFSRAILDLKEWASSNKNVCNYINVTFSHAFCTLLLSVYIAYRIFDSCLE